MKKKLVCFMLSSMMVLSLAACGGEETAADSTVTTQVEVSAPSDTVADSASSDTVAEATDSESTDSTGVLYGLTMEEIPDLADTTWDFAGGMIDGTEMTEDEYNTVL